MEIQVDRSLSIPIYTQIVGQIQFGIVSGMLPSGAQLPSIRDLASKLQVAPMTITQAYQELKQLGLIEMRSGRGTFVSDFDATLHEPTAPNRHLHLRRHLQRTIAEALADGFTSAEITHVLMSILSDSDHLSTTPSFLLVGLFSRALRIYADDIERRFSGARVTVEPLTFDELEPHPEYFRNRLSRVDAVLTPLHQMQRVRNVLAVLDLVQSVPVVGLSFEVRRSVKQRLTSLPPGLRVGIISRFPEFVNTMVQGVASIYTTGQEPLVCLADEEERLLEMAAACEVIVYATGAEAAVETLTPILPADFPCIEYLHTPDEAAFIRLQHLLDNQVDTPYGLGSAMSPDSSHVPVSVLPTPT